MPRENRVEMAGRAAGGSHGLVWVSIGLSVYTLP
jgi:hypothetical protein